MTGLDRQQIQGMLDQTLQELNQISPIVASLKDQLANHEARKAQLITEANLLTRQLQMIPDTSPQPPDKALTKEDKKTIIKAKKKEAPKKSEREGPNQSQAEGQEEAKGEK